jgi:FlaA1/EpsC-like NDP-sugar epimerase
MSGEIGALDSERQPEAPQLTESFAPVRGLFPLLFALRSTFAEPMSRLVTRTTQTLIDVTVLTLAYWGAFILRFEWPLPHPSFKLLVVTWPYVVGLEFFVLYLFAVPRFAWRYVGLREVGRVLWATSSAAGVLLVGRLLLPSVQPHWAYASYGVLPAGVILANFMLAFLGITGVRVVRRLLGERSASQELRRRPSRTVPTLLIGAGQAGVLVAKEIAARPDLGIEPVGFLDDDPVKVGSILHGVPVLGTTHELAQAASRTGALQAIITIATATGPSIRRIVKLCATAELRVQIIPGIFELLDGTVNLARMRDVSIEDLLGREPVELDLGLIRGFLEGKRVLVTGAGGSIGSELCRQVARFAPDSLVLLEQAENSLFTIHQELVQRFPGLTVVPRVCDVCDSVRVDSIFVESRPEVVFHAAAHKHVPMMEWNPGEAIKNNVFGTRKVAEAADRFGSEAFVMISTDKAVNPTSVMGATKRVAEMVIQAISRRSRTKYVAVRFGNVLGSAGSVIPIFKEQILAGGPVTVTHPEMKRYFMTIPEACQLVMQASAMGEGGEIFVLDMGEPVKIVDLAEELIRLSGFEPGKEIEIVFTGIRPGEKLFEEIGFDAERMAKTAHAKIYVGRLSPCDPHAVARSLSYLAEYTNRVSSSEARAALARVVPEMQVPDGELYPTQARPVTPISEPVPSQVQVATA